MARYPSIIGVGVFEPKGTMWHACSIAAMANELRTGERVSLARRGPRLPISKPIAPVRWWRSDCAAACGR